MNRNYLSLLEFEKKNKYILTIKSIHLIYIYISIGTYNVMEFNYLIYKPNNLTQFLLDKYNVMHITINDIPAVLYAQEFMRNNFLIKKKKFS